jgi:hypothetical protein
MPTENLLWAALCLWAAGLAWAIGSIVNSLHRIAVSVRHIADLLSIEGRGGCPPNPPGPRDPKR